MGLNLAIYVPSEPEHQALVKWAPCPRAKPAALIACAQFDPVYLVRGPKRGPQSGKLWELEAHLQ